MKLLKLNWWFYTPMPKLIDSSRKLFLANTVKLKPSLLVDASLHTWPLTFVTDAFHLVAAAK